MAVHAPVRSLSERRDGGQVSWIQAVTDVISAIGRDDDLATVLNRVNASVQNLLQSDGSLIWMRQGAGDRFQLESSEGINPEPLLESFSQGSGLGAQLASREGPLILSHAELLKPGEDRRFIDFQCALLPIRHGQAVIGYLGAVRDGPESIRQEDLEQLELFLRYATVAITSSGMLTRERRRTRRMELLARLGSILTAGMNLQETLQKAADTLHEELGYRYVTVALVNEQELEVKVCAGLNVRLTPDIARRPLDSGMMGRAARTRKLQRVDDVTQDPDWYPPPGGHGIVSALVLPLIHTGRLLGMLSIEQNYRLNADDEQSMRIVADYLATAISNSELMERGREFAQFRERQRIQMDLHDSVVQTLTSINLMSQVLSSQMVSSVDQAEETAQRIGRLARQAMAETRDLLSRLKQQVAVSDHSSDSPAGWLRARGLNTTLQRLLQQVSWQGFETRLVGDDPGDLADNVEYAILRVTEEALSNSVKHSRADSIIVSLSRHQNGLALSIVDDGQGFDPSNAPKAGMGLENMRRRIRLISGTITLKSAPGMGTTVAVQIPESSL